jgi:hypothetical protein
MNDNVLMAQYILEIWYRAYYKYGDLKFKTMGLIHHDHHLNK